MIAIIVKITITMALALIGTRLARRSRAAVRHALLAAAFAVLVIMPFATIVVPPVRIAVPAVVAVPQRIVSPAPVADFESIPSRVVTPALPLSSILNAIWIAGVALSLAPMLMGLWQVRSLRRSGFPWAEGEAMVPRRVEVLLDETLTGPMTCGVLHPAIIFPVDAQVWPPEDLRRALVHELEHVRRSDWLVHCLARAVCAAYWFHPLVWIALRRLTLEAERSCDDAVLRRSEATAYADQLVGLARRLSSAGREPLLAMANRADLATRVRAVLDSRQQRGRAGALAVALACAASVALVIAVSPLRMAAAPQQFDAVSVKLVDPHMQGSHSHERADPKRISITMTMHSLILHAYGLTAPQLSGEPEWFKTHLYTIEAVTSIPANGDEKMLMLRGALADRFQLKLRQEDRDLPVYALEVAPGGPKFKALKAGEEPQDGPDIPGTFARSFNSIKDLMNVLNGVNGGRLSVDRPVIDHTHLTGEHNMQLRTEMETQNDDFGQRVVLFPGLFQDIQRELGLKLVSDHLKMPCFVVEHAAEPTAN